MALGLGSMPVPVGIRLAGEARATSSASSPSLRCNPPYMWGVRISKEGEESIRTRKVCVSCPFFLAKQMHFCLANRISKFRVKTRKK